jgi:hypothetical protein
MNHINFEGMTKTQRYNIRYNVGEQFFSKPQHIVQSKENKKEYVPVMAYVTKKQEKSRNYGYTQTQ